MTRLEGLQAGLAAIALAAAAAVPFLANGYALSLAISIAYFAVLATAWAIFSGPTGFVSLATAAFFGIGAYAAAMLGETSPTWLVLGVAALAGGGVAAVTGFSTLRLSGIYFVVFTFGLAELIRQIVIWYEVNVHRSVGRYLFSSTTQEELYWQLLALLCVVLLCGWLLGRSRYGLALRAVGSDEVAARHMGIDATAVKLATFVLSAIFMTVTGAIMAPRWTYIDPAIAFNPMISFEVVIMALLGGSRRLLGPLLGVVPLVILFEVLTAAMPNYFSVVLGLAFILIVVVLPNGVLGLLARPPRWRALPFGVWRRRPAADRPAGSPGQETLLAAHAVSRSFGGLRAVDNVSFTVGRGEIVGLIGPNGSGKTTLLNLVSGAITAQGGAIRLGRDDITTRGATAIARLGIARTFQLVRVFPAMNCRENTAVAALFGADPAHPAEVERRIDDVLGQVGLADKAETPTDQLTYIDQKRLELARALALEPQVLLLDEWLAGLNPTELGIGIALIGDLRRRGLTIIMVEHVMDAIRALCDHCIVMSAGQLIAAGPTDAVLRDPAVIAAYLGDDDA